VVLSFKARDSATTPHRSCTPRMVMSCLEADAIRCCSQPDITSCTAAMSSFKSPTESLEDAKNGHNERPK
jgi:hypothetical protein